LDEILEQIGQSEQRHGQPTLGSMYNMGRFWSS
jgi:hypothetical protein